MKCSLCGGYVEWKGPLSNLTHTECADCGGTNCQEVEFVEYMDPSDDPREIEADYRMDEMEDRRLTEKDDE